MSSASGTDDFEDRKRTLLATDPSEFVAARNALARELRAEKDGATAAAVGKLRRLPVPVWALNRVARDAPDAVEALADAAATVRNAQMRAAAGNAPPALRQANAALRRAIDDVAGAARAVVTASGRSEDAYARDIDRAVAEIAGSERRVDELRRAVLTNVDAGDDDVFAQLAASVDVPAAPPSRRASHAPTDAVAKKRARLEARLAEDSDKAAEAHDALTEAEQALRSAQQRYDRAVRAAEQAESAVEQRRAALERLDG